MNEIYRERLVEFLAEIEKEISNNDMDMYHVSTTEAEYSSDGMTEEFMDGFGTALEWAKDYINNIALNEEL